MGPFATCRNLYMAKRTVKFNPTWYMYGLNCVIFYQGYTKGNSWCAKFESAILNSTFQCILTTYLPKICKVYVLNIL